jgi:hypothetical protein
MLKIRNLGILVMLLTFSLLSACAIEPVYRGPYMHPTYVSPGPEWGWRAHLMKGGDGIIQTVAGIEDGDKDFSLLFNWQGLLIFPNFVLH